MSAATPHNGAPPQWCDRCDLSLLPRAEIADRARELLHTGIGLGILGFQRLQVLRREHQPAAERLIASVGAEIQARVQACGHSPAAERPQG